MVLEDFPTIREVVCPVAHFLTSGKVGVVVFLFIMRFSVNIYAVTTICISLRMVDPIALLTLFSLHQTLQILGAFRAFLPPRRLRATMLRSVECGATARVGGSCCGHEGLPGALWEVAGL
jgi:hypothetical protein